MLEGETVVIQHLQHLHTEADLIIHHSLLDIDSREALFAGDTCDSMSQALAAEVVVIRNDHSAWVLGTVSISDIDRDTCASYGEDSVLMEHRSTHVSQLSQLPVSDDLDSIRVLDYPRVSHQESGNVCPVLINLSSYSVSYNSARNIGASP